MNVVKDVIEEDLNLRDAVEFTPFLIINKHSHCNLN